LYYTYILPSKTHPEQTYVGSTEDLKRRLFEHNSGKSPHTSKYLPWDISVYVAFLRGSERSNLSDISRAAQAVLLRRNVFAL